MRQQDSDDHFSMQQIDLAFMCRSLPQVLRQFGNLKRQFGNLKRQFGMVWKAVYVHERLTVLLLLLEGKLAGRACRAMSDGIGQTLNASKTLEHSLSQLHIARQYLWTVSRFDMAQYTEQLDNNRQLAVV